LLKSSFCQLNAIGESRTDPIEPREDIARPIKSWTRFLGYLMSLGVVSLEDKFAKLDALGDATDDMVHTVDYLGIA